MKNSKLLAIAKSAALESGKLFKKNFGKAKHVTLKGGDFRNQVTEVDVAIEKLIIKMVAKKLPTSEFIGEEMSPDNHTAEGIFWIIDPIDGTTNYIQGIPLCCISIAAWDKTGPLAAVLYNPITNEMITAAKGAGAHYNNKKIRVSTVTEIPRALGGLGWFNPEDAKRLVDALVGSVRKMRVLATSAWQLGMVAVGSFDFYVTSDVHIWDVAAGILIIEEAGGTVTAFDGSIPGLSVRNIVGSNGKLHKKLLQQVKGL